VFHGVNYIAQQHRYVASWQRLYRRPIIVVTIRL
jgi:hypothetical protein